MLASILASYLDIRLYPMENLSITLRNRIDRVTRPEPTVLIFKGEEYYITDTGEQFTRPDVHIRLSAKFRDQQLAQLKGAPLSVFLCLALHIGQEGRSYPSISLICRETGYNKDTVFQALNKLEFMGYIARRQKTDPETKRFKSNVYQLFPKSVNYRLRK